MLIRSEKFVARITGLYVLMMICLPIIISNLAVAMQNEQGILVQLNQKLIDIEHVMSDAQALQVNILSPNVFREALKNYENAKTDIDKRRDVKTISKNLTKAEELLALSIKNSKEAKKQLPQIITAREDALAAGAPDYALSEFTQAEQYFNDAMTRIEENDINGALKKGKEGEDKYREAELIAIKGSIIGSVHELLLKAKEIKADKFAPQTYGKAQLLIQESEKILNTNRNAQATAREKAEQAEYEAQHAIYLSQLIQDTRKEDANWENLFLNSEKELAGVASLLNVELKFDKGLDNAIQSLKYAVTATLDDKNGLARNLEQTNEELKKQRAENRALASELDATKQQEAGLKEKLEEKRIQEEKIKRVESLFSVDEAIVLREGENLVIRLAGLNFASGRSIIEAKYFSILTKVQRAIREFPNSPVIIEGHTDSKGNSSANMSLSNARANAVKSYLQANMGLPESQIQSIGYGSEKPIASNDTEEGRTKNRRIDVVLQTQGTY